jgi:hypothetical protein
MHANPSALDTRSLTACLRSSAGEERDRQVDFLRYLDPFDAREAYREAGHDSLWQFCLRELSLREGAAGRRIGAMRVLRLFPRLEAPLRDGRLSLTTVVTLRPVLTEENLGEIVARAAAVKRAVWERDGGRCTYVSPEGRRCDSRWRLELDHVEPAARGGPSTVEGLRLRCRAHNILHAEESFGRAYMARFRHTPSAEGAAIAGESAR